MKTALHSLLFLALACTASGQLPFTYETEYVLTSSGDFTSADGRRDVTVVDRTSGLVTLGIQQASGSFVWTDPEPSGISGVTGLAVGAFNGGSSDVVAVTAPQANRIMIAARSTVNPQLIFRPLYPVNPMPLGIAPFDPNNDGSPDLLVVGDREDLNGSRYYYELMTGVQSTASALWQTQFAQKTHRISRFVQKTGVAPVVAEMYGGLFYVETLTPTGLTNARGVTGVTVNSQTLMTWGNFDTTAFGQVVIYNPGSTTAKAAKATEPTTGNYAWGTTTTLNFPKAVRQLSTIPSGTGAALAVLFEDTTAAVYNFSGTTLTLRNSLPGDGHEWLNPIGPDAMISKNYAGWQRWNTSPTSGTLTPTHTGAFPYFESKRQVSNIVFLTGEAFVDPDSQIIGFGNVRDWSTAVSGFAQTWSVTASSYTGDGLGVATTSSYAPTVATANALANQHRGNISVRSLEGAAGEITPDVIISPPSSVFRPRAQGDLNGIPITFTTTTLGHHVRYRINGSAWLDYDPRYPPEFDTATTVQAYARGFGSQSVIRTATYSFSNAPALAVVPSADENDNDLPDEWEKAFGIDEPEGDEDDDGVSNYDEYIAGTDPRDALDKPEVVRFRLHASIVGAAPARVLRLEWQTALGAVSLESSDDLSPSVWSQITGGITTVGAYRRYELPLGAGAAPQRRFYRLREAPPH